jgi:hypothetical protein
VQCPAAAKGAVACACALHTNNASICPSRVLTQLLIGDFSNEGFRTETLRRRMSALLVDSDSQGIRKELVVTNFARVRQDRRKVGENTKSWEK